MRKIKTKSKEKQVEAVTGQVVPSKAGRVQIALKALSNGVLLNKEDIEILTDYAAVAESVAKELTADVKLIKTGILVYAEKNKIKKMAGVKGMFSIGASTSTEQGTPTEFVKILKKLGKISIFDDLVSVKIGEAKKYLGEKVLESEGFLKKTTNAYGKVGLKIKG